MWRWSILLLLGMVSCTSETRQLELELRKSIQTFLLSVKDRDQRGLEASVYFPGVSDYRQYVMDLQLRYLEQAQSEEATLTFDDQGVVLGRFLGLLHNRYVVESIELDEEGRNATMRIAVNFNYDENIAYDIRTYDYESGTKFLIPGDPWGKVYTITLDGDNPAPREQLKRAEAVVEFRKTNFEGLWQIRSFRVDESALVWETSFRTEFR